VVAFTGGGGKTTSMFRLAADIGAAGGRVITTTTTRIFAAQIALAPRHLEAAAATPAALRAVLAQHPHVLVTGPVEAASGKALGVAPAAIDAWRALPGPPAVLVEADGSRMRPFKAPAEHEPVIPASATVVVVVVGADVFGAPLDDERVHRAARAAALAGVPLGTAVTPEMVAGVVAHAQGGLKGVPPSARVVALINKVEAGARLGVARQAAERLLAAPRIHSVVLGGTRREPPALETWGRTAAVVLAAGQSTRMGRSKQLLPWGDTTVIGEVVRRMQASGVAQVVVVTGAERAAVEAQARQAARPGGPPVTMVYNPDYAAAEMARSLQAAVRVLPEDCLAAVVALVDQPQLPPEVVAGVVERWRATQAPIVAPFYRGQRGQPVLFDRRTWPALLALPAGANPRELVRAATTLERVDVDTDAVLRDLDTPEDYARERGRGG
jgi:molybdenum cofactor cytidylyltransferase